MTTETVQNGTQTRPAPNTHQTRGTQDPDGATPSRDGAVTLVLPASVRALLDGWREWYYPGQEDVAYRAIAEEMLAVAHTRGSNDNQRAETKAARVARLAGR